jgi:hypothetical protein
MKNDSIARLVAREGLVGLQKLEAWKVIAPDFSKRVGNVYNVSVKEASVAKAVANGLGRCSDLERLLEMIEWLREGEYLIDYGYITVSLLISVTYEKPTNLPDSKYIKIIQYFRSLTDDENEIFCLGL